MMEVDHIREFEDAIVEDEPPSRKHYRCFSHSYDFNLDDKFKCANACSYCLWVGESHEGDNWCSHPDKVEDKYDVDIGLCLEHPATKLARSNMCKWCKKFSPRPDIVKKVPQKSLDEKIEEWYNKVFYESFSLGVVVGLAVSATIAIVISSL